MSRVLAAGAALFSIMIATSASAQSTVQYFAHPNPAKPFSPAVRVGDIVHVSGATGYAADGTLPEDFSVQAKNTMDQVARELKVAGATMDQVYKCNVALTNMDNWDAFNLVYKTYFKPGRLPVRMAIGVTSLGGSAVEVQCEASLAG